MRTLISAVVLVAFWIFCNSAMACLYAIRHVKPGPPCCSQCGEQCKGSPNVISTGDYQTSATDLQLPTRGFPLAVTRMYQSQRGTDGPLGFGNLSNLTARVVPTVNPADNSQGVVVQSANGHMLYFKQLSGGSYQPPVESHDTLVKNGDGTYDFKPALTRSNYHYAASGELLQMRDDYGNTLNLTYDGNGALLSVADGTGSGRNFTFLYGPNGRISQITDSTGRYVSYGYNSSGAMTTFTDAAFRTTSYGYVNGLLGPMLQTITDPWGRNVTTLSYDSVGRLSSYTEAGEAYTYDYLSDPANPSYDENNKYKTRKKITATGFTKTFTYDPSLGVITDILYSGVDNHDMFQYFPDAQIKRTQQDSTIFPYYKIITDYNYNANGSLDYINRYFGHAYDDTKFTYIYGDSNFPEKVTDILPKRAFYDNSPNRDWQEWRYDYWPPGSAAPGALYHVIRVKSDGTTATIATYTYNSYGQVLSVADAAGSLTNYGYDPTTGDLTSAQYPKNSDTGINPGYIYIRDGAGRVLSTTDPLGKVTSYTYDNLDRILTVTLQKPTPSSADFITTYAYDIFEVGNGLVFTRQTDPNGKVTRQGYDQYGQLSKSTDGQGHDTTFSYSRGLLFSITDANGNVTSYTYAADRSLASTVFPGGATETYVFKGGGLLSRKTDRRGQINDYLYDSMKRLKLKCYGALVSDACPSGTWAEQYGYVGQKLMTATFASQYDGVNYSYDTSYRLLTVDQLYRGSVTYTYTPTDRVETMAITGGPTSTYGYYPDGSLRSINWSILPGNFLYQYRLNGQYDTITFPNSQMRAYTYDDQGRLTQVANTHPSAGDLGTYGYGYDVDATTGAQMLGQRTTMTTAAGQTKYHYDGLYQLTGVDYPNAAPFNGEADGWTYDFIGNRQTNTVNSSTQNYTYFTSGTKVNRLQSDSVHTFDYDNNGNATSDGTYSFSWDAANRMRVLSGGTPTYTYVYDAHGLRTTKSVGGTATYYLYDGQNLVAEKTSGVNTYYLFGPGIDEPLAQSQNSNITFYNVDGLGSVTSLNDSTGAIQQTYTYDAWGNVRATTGTLANPFTYTARESGQSAEAGLMFYRARYLQPSIGRFISEDPMGFKAGPNFYRYVFNTPIKLNDPLGLLGTGGGGVIPIWDKSCCDDRGPAAGNAAKKVCTLVNQPGPCRQMILKYSQEYPGMITCFRFKLCKGLLNISCEDQPPTHPDECGTVDGDNGIVLFPKAFSGCGKNTIQGTVAHEMAHLCGAPSDNFWGMISSWVAYEIGDACDPDHLF